MRWLSGDPYRPGRRPTRVVRVGDVAIGGEHPIVVQSMTNTDTMDTEGTVEQITRLAEAGCEIVRVTAPSIRDAENLRAIRQQLRFRGIEVPLVADIHFTPNAAMIAAEVAEKVRINPGNYADKKKFEIREYDDAAYAVELERVAERFRPLVRRCKERGVAMRIGTNHGSLSDRIMNRFGDTPQGMVESALEFLDVCEDEGYREVVFSMKASNTQVAIQAYRLLAARLAERAPGEPSYPFHVGVTEAGDAEDGRIKSAIGIGSLLEDGLGDTIRVSLTEDPVREVPVARALAAHAEAALRRRAEQARPTELRSDWVADPFAHARRATRASNWGGLTSWPTPRPRPPGSRRSWRPCAMSNASRCSWMRGPGTREIVSRGWARRWPRSASSCPSPCGSHPARSREMRRPPCGARRRSHAGWVASTAIGRPVSWPGGWRPRANQVPGSSGSSSARTSRFRCSPGGCRTPVAMRSPTAWWRSPPMLRCMRAE
jgi:1-hydroxy-2-methyl-2-(E)-butenyl 4-diphosphate synthase